MSFMLNFLEREWRVLQQFTRQSDEEDMSMEMDHLKSKVKTICFFMNRYPDIITPFLYESAASLVRLNFHFNNPAHHERNMNEPDLLRQLKHRPNIFFSQLAMESKCSVFRGRHVPRPKIKDEETDTVYEEF